MKRFGKIAYLLIFVLQSGVTRGESDYTDSTNMFMGGKGSAVEIPVSSISQLLYKPKVRTDVPYTSIYRSIYAGDNDDESDNSDDFRSPFASDPFLNSDPFNRARDLDFRAPTDILGADKALRDTHLSEAALGCREDAYISEVFDPKTLSYKARCVSLNGPDDSSVAGNSFLGDEMGSIAEKNFGDKNSFVAGVEAQAQADASQAKGYRNNQYQQLKMQISPEMLQMIERYAENNPYLQEILAELEATGDIRGAFRKVREGGLQSLIQGMPALPAGAGGYLNP